MENERSGGIRACIYNRCSTEEEAQINALEIQAAESRELVEKNGWIVTAQYIESQSGTTSGKRKEYQRLFKDLETDLFDIVVIKSIDRLTRSARDWYLFLDRLTQCGKRLYLYIDRKFYAPEDNLLTGIKAILAEDFSRELSKKIKNAHRRRQEKGTGLNITVPIFGWDKAGKDSYVINEKEAEAYRMGFALALEGKGFYSIAKIMYANGIRSKSGGRISEVQWRKLLYSPRAHGTVVLHTKEYDFETKKNIWLPESEWIRLENALPPIVSREYQMQVLEELHKRAAAGSFTERAKKRRKAGRYALSGKLYCASCGSPYYRKKIVSGRGEKILWQCSTAIRQGRVCEGKNTGCNNKTVTEESVFAELLKNSEAAAGDSCGEDAKSSKAAAGDSCGEDAKSSKAAAGDFGGEDAKNSEAAAGDSCGEDAKNSEAAAGDFYRERIKSCEKEVKEKLEKALWEVICREEEENRKEENRCRAELEKLAKKKTLLLQKLLDEVINDDEYAELNRSFKEKEKELEEKLEIIRAKKREDVKESKRLFFISEAITKELMMQAIGEELTQRVKEIRVCPDGSLGISWLQAAQLFGKHL